MQKKSRLDERDKREKLAKIQMNRAKINEFVLLKINKQFERMKRLKYAYRMR